MKGSIAVQLTPGSINMLEPAAAVRAFLDHPPVGFASFEIRWDGVSLPAFFANFDLLTTLDDDQQWVNDKLQKWGLKRFLTFPALFAGTTVSEYFTFTDSPNFRPILSKLFGKFEELKAQFLIIKDLPDNSPLLGPADNHASDRFLQACLNAGYLKVSGQALAYVPIDFENLEQYLAGLSYARRKEFRRKLRKSRGLQVEEMRTGNKAFLDPAFLDHLYRLYLNVYEQSKYHFDKLSPDFFAALLRDSTNGGVVFVYRSGEKMVGYNICFICNGNLVDKYIGLQYPDAREHNLYFASWFYNLEYALRHGLANYIAGWTDPEVKAALGARFTFTRHAVYIRNPVLRMVLRKLQRFFEPDKKWSDQDSGRHSR